MARAQPHRTVSIYVFEVPGFRKIGIAADVERRRDQVQAMNPCQVRALLQFERQYQCQLLLELARLS